MTKKVQKRTGKYWLCDKCAEKKDLYLPRPNGLTVIYGLCGHCKRKDECTLIPIVDWASRDGKKRYAGD